MLRRPGSPYTIGRSNYVLKVKTYEDAEATVIRHLSGSGKNAGRLGSLLVELPNGIQFAIGTGFSDQERDDPPPVGSVITFKYYGFYKIRHSPVCVLSSRQGRVLTGIRGI